MEDIISKNNKIQLALSSIMFFSPLIKKDLEKSDIDTKDKEFINGYIKYGNINLITLIITIILGLIAYLSENKFINIIYQILLWALTLALITQITFIITSLINNKQQILGKKL